MNIYAIRLFECDFGNLIDVVELFRKVSVHTIITEEINPYQHYHLMVYSDKSLKQMKKFVSNHTKVKKMRIRRRNNTNVQVVQNEPAYRRYIQKDYVKGFDSYTGWMTSPKEYLYDFEDVEPEAQHFWEFQRAIEESNMEIRSKSDSHLN